MLAVMTMNVGYFLFILAGLFVGELAISRYTQGHSVVPALPSDTVHSPLQDMYVAVSEVEF